MDLSTTRRFELHRTCRWRILIIHYHQILSAHYARCPLYVRRLKDRHQMITEAAALTRQCSDCSAIGDGAGFGRDGPICCLVVGCDHRAAELQGDFKNAYATGTRLIKCISSPSPNGLIHFSTLLFSQYTMHTAKPCWVSCYCSLTHRLGPIQLLTAQHVL